ncbi:MFS transporter [Chloroflexota bacterium]
MPQSVETTYRYRWVILGILWITFIVVYLNRLCIGPLAPFLKENMALTNTQIGIAMSATSFGFLVVQLPLGFLVDRIGARWPIAIGELIAGASLTALFFVPSYTWLLIFLFITGLGCGFLQPATAQGVIIWFPQHERATVMGLKQTSFNIGGIITAIGLPIVALSLGWRYGFLFLGITAIAIGITAFILYKEPPSKASPEDAGMDTPKPMSLANLLKNREIWMVGAVGFCFSWIEIAAIAYLVLHLTEILLFSVVAAGGLLAMAQATGGIGRPLTGFLSDRVFRARRKPVLILLATIVSASCLFLSLLHPYVSWEIYPVIFLLGLGGIAFGGVFLTLLGELGGPRGAGKVVGLGSTIAVGGSTVGPIVFGYIIDISGSYQLAWLSLAFLGVLTLLLLLFIHEEKRKA